jgi:hypothetical protein
MPQRNKHCSLVESSRFATVSALLQLCGTLPVVLVLVLLITNGGAG